MTLSRLILVSAFMHGAVLCAVNRHPQAPLPVDTDRWTVDLSTLLVSEQSGDAAEPPELRELLQAATPPPAEESTQDGPAPEEPAAPEPKTPADAAPAPQVTATDAAGARAAAIGNAFRNTLSNQSIVAFLSAYHRASTSAVNGIVTGALTYEQRRNLEGSRGTVVVSFRDGDVTGLEIVTDNDTLRTLLSSANWGGVPSPKHYRLPVSRMAYTIFLDRGKIGVTPSVL